MDSLASGERNGSDNTISMGTFKLEPNQCARNKVLYDRGFTV